MNPTPQDESGPKLVRAQSRWSLAGKKALVTGGSRGIGRAVAEELLNFGAAVLVAARSRDGVNGTVEAWRAQGLEAHGIDADVSHPSGRSRIQEAVGSTLGGLDILINNAGSNIRKPAVEYTLEEYRRVLETNLESAFDLSCRLHPLLKAAGSGSIVNVSSIAANLTIRTGVPYGMTKAALLQMTRGLAVEWAQDRIRVNAVLPGFTRTPLTERLFADRPFVEGLIRRTPLGRLGEPEDIAGAVVFLCLPAASFVTGQSIAADGGFLALGYWPETWPSASSAPIEPNAAGD